MDASESRDRLLWELHRGRETAAKVLHGAASPALDALQQQFAPDPQRGGLLLLPQDAALPTRLCDTSGWQGTSPESEPPRGPVPVAQDYFLFDAGPLRPSPSSPDLSLPTTIQDQHKLNFYIGHKTWWREALRALWFLVTGRPRHARGVVAAYRSYREFMARVEKHH